MCKVKSMLYIYFNLKTLFQVVIKFEKQNSDHWILFDSWSIYKCYYYRRTLISRNFRKFNHLNTMHTHTRAHVYSMAHLIYTYRMYRCKNKILCSFIIFIIVIEGCEHFICDVCVRTYVRAWVCTHVHVHKSCL